MELIKYWRKEGFSLRLYDTGKTDGYGKSRLSYKFRDKGKLIFEGNDFCPSPMYADDSLTTVYTLLSFLSLKRGDTDAEYFENYTKEQLDWRDSDRCDTLAMLVYEFENKE